MTDWTYTATSKICDKCGYTTFRDDAEPHECLDGLLSLRDRLEAAEARIESLERENKELRESHAKELLLLSDVTMDHVKLKERLQAVEGWMKAELRAK